MTVNDAYAYCRAIAHKHGANFSVGFRFLPRQKRQAVYAAYAFCRFADDIADEDEPAADGPQPPGELKEDSRLSADGGLPAADRLARLDQWENELEACYRGSPSHPITIALADALLHFQIPKDAFIDLIDGCRQDMVKNRYETFEELLEYCRLVAASISDISLSIFGYRSDDAVTHGRSLSTALQLTNVTRDIGDDLSRDRIYVPQEELRQFGLSDRDLFERRESGPVRALIEFQIARAESYFQAAEPLLDELAFDARFPTLLMGGIYATVLAKLKKDPFAAIRKRLRLSSVQKVLVVGSRMLRPHFV